MGFWFRQHYRVPPTDPRYLSMTDRDLFLEYEAHLAFEGGELKQCPICGRKTHRSHCPECRTSEGKPFEITGDPAIDEVNRRLEVQDEDLDPDEIDRILSAGLETVPRGTR